MASRIFAAESAVYRTVGLIDEALVGKEGAEAVMAGIEEYAVEASIIKVLGSEVLDYVVDEGVQIHGGYGYSQEYPIERAYRDARINRIFEGTNEINRLLIPGMLLRRALKGHLPLFQAAMRLQKELLEPSFEEPEDLELYQIAGLKKLFLMVAGLAAQRYGQGVEEEQEVLAAAADILIDAYAAESAVLRARRLGDLAQAMARVYLVQALDRAQMPGRLAVLPQACGGGRGPGGLLGRPQAHQARACGPGGPEAEGGRGGPRGPGLPHPALGLFLLAQVLGPPPPKGGGVISQRLYAPPGAFLGILHDDPQGLEPVPD
jgi:hypothetical protein